MHGTLDILGMVPFFGEVADVANGLLYLAEGNYLEAGLSFAAVVPFAGAAVTGAKFTRNATKAVRASRTVARIETGIGATAAAGRAQIDNIAARFGRQGTEAFEGGVRNVTPNAGRVGDDAVASGRAASNGASSCRIPMNSFVPGTPVLMADGSLVAIEDIELGDLVWATDPVTGEEGPRPVTALVEGTGDKVLVEVRTADGGVFVATDGHPIWEATDSKWVNAGLLEVGDVLVGEDGPVTVSGINVTTRWATVHNVTVDDIHTYSVHNGHDELLTHNCGEQQRLFDADNFDDILPDAPSPTFDGFVVANVDGSPGGSPALPSNPWSPGNVSQRQSDTRRQLGTGNLDLDSIIPDQRPGRDLGGHSATPRVSHDGQRNIGAREEHSRRPKGNRRGGF